MLNGLLNLFKSREQRLIDEANTIARMKVELELAKKEGELAKQRLELQKQYDAAKAPVEEEKQYFKERAFKKQQDMLKRLDALNEPKTSTKGKAYK